MQEGFEQRGFAITSAEQLTARYGEWVFTPAALTRFRDKPTALAEIQKIIDKEGGITEDALRDLGIYREQKV